MAGAKNAKSDSFTIPLLLENTSAILQKYRLLFWRELFRKNYDQNGTNTTPAETAI